MSKKIISKKYLIELTKEQAWMAKEGLELLFLNDSYQKSCWKCRRQTLKLFKDISKIVSQVKTGGGELSNGKNKI
jgi:hypothetical protein